MDPPHFLLDALKESVTSGTFVDTKFYVFSRREASGRVGLPRALYCNSRVLDTVPYFSTCKWRGPCDVSYLTALHCFEVFSDGFSEGQQRDINGTFPSDSHPYTEYYDYLSDSDLEEEEEEPPEDYRSRQKRLKDALDPRIVQTTISDTSPQYPSSVEPSEARNNDR